MESSILEALPNIHGILIGIGTAFFSGFAMFAYQKLQESKDKLDKTLEEVASFSTPSTYIGSDHSSLISENGELNWDDEAKNILHHSKSIFSYLDYEEKYGMPRSEFSQAPSDDDVLATTRNLCLMFHYLFVSYPFSGRSMVHVKGVSENIEKRKEEPFSIERLREIERRIGFLSWCWETSNRSLIALGQKATNIEMMKAEKDAVNSFNQSIERMGETSEEEKERIWKTFHQPRLNMQVDYAKIIQEYFNKVFLYRDRVFPQLSETLKTYETFNNRFAIKRLTINALKVLAVIFIFGVLVPILLSALDQDKALIWHKSLPYFLLLITVCPYLYIWKKVFNMVKLWDFT